MKEILSIKKFERVKITKYMRWRFNITKLLLSYHWQKVISHGMPEVTDIEITNHCMYSCIMCPRENYMTREKGNMEYGLFKKIVDQVAAYNPPACLAMYGDPLLHPQFGDFIKYAKANGVSVKIPTNAINLDKKRTKILLDAKPDYIIVALDGIDEETLKKIRGKNARYKESEDNLRNFIAEKNKALTKRPFVHVRMIQMDINKNQIEDFKKKWNVNGVDLCDVKSLKMLGNCEDFQKLDKERNFSIPEGSCRLPWISVSILWNGLVVPCCMFYNDIYVLGNLYHQSLKEIWNSQKIVSLREQFINKQYKEMNLMCKRCYMKRVTPIRKLYPLPKLM